MTTLISMVLHNLVPRSDDMSIFALPAKLPNAPYEQLHPPRRQPIESMILVPEFSLSRKIRVINGFGSTSSMEYQA
jgi:hypothetical protein